ncbi:MAG TPA: DUF2505 domain-containing protein [Actinopolymorphaceae bacterium]
MKIRQENRYAADPELVFAMLCDEAFLRRRAESASSFRHEVSATHSGQTARTNLMQVFPAEVPDVVRKLVGESIELTETIEWEAPGPDRSRVGRISIAVAGAPVTLRGAITLSLSGTETLQVVEGELKAAIPLIGGRIEKEAAPAVTHELAKMERLGAEWLGGAR